jgi:hypothetical protein
MTVQEREAFAAYFSSEHGQQDFERFMASKSQEMRAEVRRKMEERREKALCGLQSGDWTLDMDEGFVSLFSDGMFVKCSTDSKSLAKAAQDLAVLAEQVKARGF